MQNVPKIVSERLRVAPRAVGRADVEHPDANLLTAFVENLLSERERSTVLGHLAGCHDCRDIMALALPVADAVQPIFGAIGGTIGQPAARPARAGWFTWPVLRWGFVAAGIVTVASFGVLQYAHESRHMVAEEFKSVSPLSQNQASQNQVSPAQPQASVGTTGPDGASEKSRMKMAEGSSDKTALLHAPAASASHVPEAAQQNTSGIIHSFPPIPQRGMRKGNAAIGGNTDALTAKTSPAQTIEVTGAAVDTNQAASSQADTVAENQAPLTGQAAAQLSENEAVIRVKPAEDGTATPAAINGRNFSQLAAVSETSPSWAINSAGSLQRSFDQGSTWQDVNVNANPATAANAVAGSMQSSDAKLATKKAPAPAAAIVFAAVVSTGADVWAGGSSGALYHSLDAGDHWMKVVPSAAGASLTGDVVRLEFSGAQHGKITTSTSEVWITADDGQTWQKQ
jgi:hypothetical protein